MKSPVHWFKSKLDNLHDYLDRELSYLDSQLYYTEQKNITNLNMEYSAYKFDSEIMSLSSMPEQALEEIIRISKKITDHTWGVILESEKVQNINVYIAQMIEVCILE